MTAGAEINLHLLCDRWVSALPDVAGRCEAAAAAALADLAEPAAVSLVLVDDAEIRRLNRNFRGMDRPTNVLAFPSDTPAGEGDRRSGDALRDLGDVFIAFETTWAEAAADAGASDPHRRFADHVAHLVVHGVLHLLGFDHADDAEAAAMEQRETAVLAGLGIADPYTVAAEVG